ncbi:YARHG domain-containing protein [Flavobacterium phycosphaerae]|uniref:YARHG domain-containing protein n=1 Tax=Flavobacterium phycosphaerae TaxID=2697515 RepID=UPI00138B0F8D|nr:YARHG domain-containing protein [Flavobacterium phycosphaerae]
MKKAVVFLVLFFFFSCKKEKPEVVDSIVKVDTNQALYGNWVGDFVVVESDSLVEETGYMFTNKINLVIKKIENNKVYGQSIVAGNSRPLLGEITTVNGKPGFILKEPGDRKDDGRFEFTFFNDTIKGKWLANDKKKYPVWERGFVLTKQVFRYNPKLMLPEDGDYIDWFSGRTDSIAEPGEEALYSELYRSASDVITKLNASTTILNESDLKNLKKLELEIIRNTIFARHGYTFKKKSFRQFFDPVDWYIPVTDDMSGKLTLIEQKILFY